MFSKILPAAAGAVLITAAGASAQPYREGPAETHPCFFITQWQGWSAPNDHTLLLRVNNRDIYQVDLSAGSSMLQAPGVHLVSRVEGSDSICNAIDLQLEVSDGHGFREPLIARSLRKLTPAEAAAVPPKYRP
ncbi:MAG TPA: hypothetical protein VGS12_12250 [Caulobacteraceae bacterium]|nr:hypothetical protein [Caulobacteraceae bacterium]